MRQPAKTIPTTILQLRPKDFAELAPLQLDVVCNPSIPDDAFERERLVVLEEIRRSEDNPGRRTFSRAMETCFERLPYRRSVLGPASAIEQLTPQQMRDFHAQWYEPQSITAAVVGNLPVDELIAIVAAGWEDVEKEGREPRKPENRFRTSKIPSARTSFYHNCPSRLC